MNPRATCVLVFIVGGVALFATGQQLALAANTRAPTDAALVSTSPPTPPAATASTSAASSPGTQTIPRSFHDDATCSRCHTTKSWLPARFPHDDTGFPLRGRHAKADCTSCHGVELTSARATSCAGCHVDRHRGSLGSTCQGCHTDETWSPRFGVEAHRRNLLPLSGRHGALPCEECHVDKRDGQFTRVTRNCVDCHRRDVDRTPAVSVDHRASRFSTDCQSCHTPLGFRQAAFPDHERCFPIAAGTIHSVVTCRQCHAPLEGLVARGTCLTNTPRCTQCHIHEPARTNAEHEGVAGYRFNDGACLGCHKASTR